MVFRFAVAAATFLLAAFVYLVNGSPGAALGFFLRNSALFVPFFDMLGLPFLFVGVLALVTTRHRCILQCSERLQASYQRVFDMAEYKPGVRVLHSVFGMGTVRAISGSGPDARITVDFGGSVGQKKLLAGMANLKPADSGSGEGSSSAAPPLPRQHWYEIYENVAMVKSGRRPFIDNVVEKLYHSLAQPRFWAAVRERLREKRCVPQVMDDLNGRVFACIHRTMPEQIKVTLNIKHDHMFTIDETVLCEAAYEQLAGWHLGDWDFPLPPLIQRQVTPTLEEKWLIKIEETDPGQLPDRDPKRRPIREQPKGVIRSRPKRRDEY